MHSPSSPAAGCGPGCGAPGAEEGLTGNLEAAGSPFNRKGWADTGMTHKGNPTWWPYEQNGYWTDGLLRCALLLKDAAPHREGHGAHRLCA